MVGINLPWHEKISRGRKKSPKVEKNLPCLKNLPFLKKSPFEKSLIILEISLSEKNFNTFNNQKYPLLVNNLPLFQKNPLLLLLFTKVWIKVQIRSRFKIELEIQSSFRFFLEDLGRRKA